MLLLLLEDDLQLGRALQMALTQVNYPTVWVRSVLDAKGLLAAKTFGAALFDIGLPDGSGLDVLDWMRKQSDVTPVIMLTARDTVSDRIAGLDMGADDYLPKPFAIPELISRIRAISRRSHGFADDIWRIGGLVIEPSKHKAALNDVALDLSLREFTLLVQLARRAGHFVTRSQLEEGVFNSHIEIESNALEVHIHNLRKKLGAGRIRTIRGVGYLLEDSES